MKKIYILAAAAALASGFGANAQTVQDALNFGQLNYMGSAYSMGIGNAVTALGGDLGTIGINPAGAAVACYSQFTITPGLTLAADAAAYAPDAYSDFGDFNRASKARFAMPNVGISFRYDDDDPYDKCEGITFAFVCNTVNSYTNHYTGSGVQRDMGVKHKASSKFAEMAYWATNDGLKPEDMASGSVWSNPDYSSYWDVVMGYNAGLIHEIAGAPGTFAGCTEVVSGTDHFFPSGSSLHQVSDVLQRGHKTEMLLNMSFDFDHKWYFGFNLAIPFGTYRNVETLYETADPIDNFPVRFTSEGAGAIDTYFKRASYRYSYTSEFSGIYAKVGFIGQPFAGLRVGASIQTPTALTVNEYWWHSGKAEYANGDVIGASSENGDFSYDLRTPWLLNAGVAYTFGKRAVVSVDYEMQDFHSMQFSDIDSYNSGVFNFVNDQIDFLCGVSHNLRAGAEFKFTPAWCIRAGYNLSTCPEKYFVDEFTEQTVYYKDLTTSYSGGFGFRSKGSFFADVAVKMTNYPDNIFSPYMDYGEFTAPDIYIRRQLWSAALTLGWRF